MKKMFLTIFAAATVALLSAAPSADARDYKDASLTPEQRATDLLSRMTTDEKIAQIRHLHSGDLFPNHKFSKSNVRNIAGDAAYGFVEGFPLSGEEFRREMRELQRYMVNETRLGIPAFIISESLHGAVQDGSTIFPQNIALASTFNPALAYRRAAAVASDLHYLGVNQVLAPCIDVTRDLRWGRVEESFGEDPFLNSRFAVNEVKGYIDNGINPMLKHFGPHGNPLGGINLSGVNCGVGEFHDVYMFPFRKVLESQPIMAVMSTYNTWNGVPNSASHYLLTDMLRDRWGFKGYVYSDWGAIGMLHRFHKTAADKAEAARQAITAGLDVEASSDCYPSIPQLIADGRLDPAVLDKAVERVLLAKFKAGLFEDPYGDRYIADAAMHSPEGVKLAREIADESTVLLKNENSLLPLDISKLKSVAVIGPNADQVQFGDYSWTRDNKHGMTPLAAIRAMAGDRIGVNYAKGCEIMTRDTTGIAAAVDAAKRSDVAIIFCGSASASLARDYSGSNCGEGFDTDDLQLTGAQPELIRAVAATGKPVVLVLVTGKPYSIAWEKENIPAILLQWYAGEREGESIADIIFGNVNPSGHLTVSMAQSVGHLPAYYNHLPGDRGYYHKPGSYENPGRDYVFSSPDPLYAFGHGLSYTDFKLSDLKIDASRPDSVRAVATVTNIGKREGKAVPQLYVRDVVSSMATPVKALKAFAKVNLKPGESVPVDLTFAKEDLAFTDNSGKTHLEDGDFEVMAGFASDNIVERATFTLGEKQTKAAVADKTETYKGTGKKMAVSGTVRDVQATVLPGVKIRSAALKKQVGVTDRKGEFRVTVPDNDTLTLSLDGYPDVMVAVRGRKVINATLAR